MAIIPEKKEELKKKLDAEYPLSGGETNEDLEKVIKSIVEDDDEQIEQTPASTTSSDSKDEDD